jgi:hypothetical protein
MDKAQRPWKIFYDINIVDITYQPFNAANWQPVASGVLGNFNLIACDRMNRDKQAINI